MEHSPQTHPLNQFGLNNLPKLREKWGKIIFTNGCFDILHVGHVRYLIEARSLGGALVVGINSDGSVRRLKGEKRPVTPQGERIEMLRALRAVDEVLVFEEDTPLELIKLVKPNILVKGGDWKVEQIVGSKEVIEAGGEVKSLAFHPGHSTSSIVTKILSL